MLYSVEKDKTLRVIPAVGDRKGIFDEAHSGTLGGHLREAKVHGQLAKHYWWPRMRADISSGCQGCITCATRHVGQAMKPCMSPIPVERPFHLVGVDVWQQACDSLHGIFNKVARSISCQGPVGIYHCKDTHGEDHS